MVNPNDTLAKRVIDIARHNHTGDGFIKAASSFGKFDHDFLLSLHSEILAYLSAVSHSAKGSENGAGPSMERGNTHVGNDLETMDDGMRHDSGDVQPAASRQRGGLMRTGDVSVFGDTTKAHS
jgi:pre-mRNA-splicing factor ATP-dependent RNA helicase DHX38/PRP16